METGSSRGPAGGERTFELVIEPLPEDIPTRELLELIAVLPGARGATVEQADQVRIVARVTGRDVDLGPLFVAGLGLLSAHEQRVQLVPRHRSRTR